MKTFGHVMLLVMLLASILTNMVLFRKLEWSDSAITILVEAVQEQRQEIKIRSEVCGNLY